MITTPFLGALLLLSTGCPAPDMKELNFAMAKPVQAELIGAWTPDKESAADIKERLGAGQFAPEIVLRSDGTFMFRDIPRVSICVGPRDNDLRGVNDATGKWFLAQVSAGPFSHWSLDLDLPSGRYVNCIAVYGKKPPYRLFLRVGDPNNAESFLFERRLEANHLPEPTPGAVH